MVYVVFPRVAVDENVIKVDHKKFTHVWAEDFFHDAHEGAWGI